MNQAPVFYLNTNTDTNNFVDLTDTNTDIDNDIVVHL